MGSHDLTPVLRLRSVKGVPLPEGVRYRQIVVTGPPGSGKTTLIKQLRGWPEEGFLDLSSPNWWRSRDLSFRPREVHFAIPFRRRSGALSLFEEKWTAEWDSLEVDKWRIRLPPEGRRPSRWDWRRRYVFLFLLAPAQEILAARRQRSYHQTHPIDTDLWLEVVERQLDIYLEVARRFHDGGLRVFVRDSFAECFKTFGAEPDDLATSAAPPSAALLFRQRIKRALGHVEPTRIDQLDQRELRGEGVRFSTVSLPVEIQQDAQRLRIFPESLADETREPPDSLLIIDPEQHQAGISAFLRLAPDSRIRMRRGAEDRWVTQRMPRDVPPRLEIAYRDGELTLIDLHSPTGTRLRSLTGSPEADPLAAGRDLSLERLRRLLDGCLELSGEESLEALEAVLADTREGRYRPSDSAGNPGGLVELPAELAPILVGDLHGQLDNLLKILSENRFLAEIEAGRACLVLLGDIVHREEAGQTREMESSLVMTDVVLRLMRTFPGRVLYLRGNHDSFSHEVTKDAVPQGQLWREHVLGRRGSAFLDAMEELYRILPTVLLAPDCLVCHAGPPLEAVSRRRIVDVGGDSRLRHQLTWNRLRKPNNPGGYTRRDIQAFKRAMGCASEVPLVVSHNPQSEAETLWTNAGGIDGYHILYSARHDRVAVLARVAGELAPLIYPVEPLTERVCGSARGSAT